MRIGAAERDEAACDMGLNQRFQAHADEFGLFLLAGIFLSAGEQLIINIDRRSHAYNDVFNVGILQAST